MANQHATFLGGKWQAKGTGNSKATRISDTQAGAIVYARELAIKQQFEVITHGKNGRIHEKNSYGNDPYPPRG